MDARTVKTPTWIRVGIDWLAVVVGFWMLMRIGQEFADSIAAADAWSGASVSGASSVGSGAGSLVSVAAVALLVMCLAARACRDLARALDSRGRCTST